MEPIRYFTDKLAAETRITIYGFIFGPSEHVTRVSGENDAEVDTAIFSTSRQISKEALETFYSINTVCLDVDQLVVMLDQRAFHDFARDIQIVNAIRCTSPAALQNALEKSKQPPRQRSVSLASDCLMYGNLQMQPPGILEHGDLAETEEAQDEGYERDAAYEEEISKPGKKPYITVRQFAEIMGLGEVTCVDVGRCELEGKFAEVEVIQIRLTSFELWVGLFEFCASFDEDSLLALPYDVRKHMWPFIGSFQHSFDLWPDKKLVGLTLSDLGPESDASALERVTEFLSRNVGTCCFMIEMADEPTHQIVKPYWCELEGGESLGTIMYERNLEKERRSMEHMAEFRAMWDRILDGGSASQERDSAE